MNHLSTLKKLQKAHNICGTEENFTIYCFRYGNIVAQYRNDIEREVVFNLNGIEASIVMNQGVTISTTLKLKK